MKRRISGDGLVARYAHDTLRRRITKTVSGSATAYVYDIGNPDGCLKAPYCRRQEFVVICVKFAVRDFEMSKDRPIGILGGMGPEATVLLQRKLIEAIPARDDSDHIPLLIDMNPQVPSRIAHLIEGTGQDPGPTLAGMARRLEAAGAAALAMPCNTAHYYAPSIVEAVSIPLLNMVELAVEHASDLLGAGGRVGMLASPAVRSTGLFDTLLVARGLSVVWPENEERVLAAIREIKVKGPSQDARSVLLEASANLATKGAGLQFVACSEFSLIADSVAPSVHAIDTIDLLTKAIVEFHRSSGSA